MPTTIKISKRMILDAAFEIAREKGVDQISNRELAKILNCSIRPIYYQFKNVEELNKELNEKIEEYFFSYLINNVIDEIPKYKQIGINYIKFAKNEPKLYTYLFMSDSKLGIKKFVGKGDSVFTTLEGIIKKSTQLSHEEIMTFHTKMWIFTHGLATLIACNTLELTDKDISNLLSSEFQALMLLEENPNNKWVLNNWKEEK